MFPPNLKEISFQISSTPQDPESIAGQYAVAENDLYPSKIKENRTSKTLRPNPFFSHKDDKKTADDDHSQRIKHRDGERQRRREMTTLYTNLKNLLPPEYIKGKRAMSDHIDDTVKYIKDQEKNIEKLRLQRDGLKKQSYLTNPDNENLGSSTSTHVIVRWSCIGIEVVIDTGLVRKQVLNLSQALELLHEEGLNVVSCVSTRVNQKMIHTIQSEVSNLTCIDIFELQSKLIKAIPSSNTTENFG